MLTVERNCECCDKNVAVAVCSSTMTAMSFAICKECLRENAEPLSIFHATFWCIGGTEVVDHIRWMKSYKDGKYIGFDEIARLWKEEHPGEIDYSEMAGN
jgi:hypothetical protein